MNKTLWSILISLVMISGCSTISNNKLLSKAFDIPPIPKQSFENRSGIAITVDQDYGRVTIVGNHIDFGGKFKIKEIFFIKLNDRNDSLKKDKTIASDYYYEPVMAGFQADAVDNFLLDVEPGFYAAVGAKAGRYYLYFPEEIIKASVVEVKANRMVYMGEFKLEEISRKSADNSPDNFQYHYYSNLLLGGHRYDIPGKVVIPWGHSTLFHAPKENKIIKSEEVEIDFLESYRGHFKKSGWEAAIENRLSDLKQ